MCSSFGHDAGDAAIKDTARVLVSVFGEDNVYRIGGDEFVAIVKAPAETGIAPFFAQVDEATAETNGTDRPYGIPLSISKGSAVYSPGDSYIDTFRVADGMMFEDKIAYYRATGYQRASGAMAQN
jgi:diguanylate cyclase (GGDEF)-like protein